MVGGANPSQMASTAVSADRAPAAPHWWATMAAGRGGRDVVGVSRDGAAGQLGVDSGAAAPGVIQALDDGGGRPLAVDEAVAVQVEGAAGLLRLVVAGGG